MHNLCSTRSISCTPHFEKSPNPCSTCNKTKSGHSLFTPSSHCGISVPPNRSHELLTHIAFNLSVRSDAFTRHNGQEFIICKGDISLDVTFCFQHILQQSVKNSVSVSRCCACGLPTEGQRFIDQRRIVVKLLIVGFVANIVRFVLGIL
jgi:hypothetical protein